MSCIELGICEVITMKELSLYIHIPFCVRKCNYCDFLSAPATTAVQEQYLHALLHEIKGRSTAFRDRLVNTIFIGGGTPSIMPAEHIELIMNMVKSCFNIATEAEISIEVNPGTVKCKDDFDKYKAAGINRISIGLQSANDDELKTLGRIHTYSDFVQTWEWAREAGFDNINVDVMAALPGQTIESYEETLHKICALGPEHISAYSLIIEEGTPFFEQYSHLLENEEYEEKDRAMYALTERLLAGYGYKRYEISNYARENKACRHNLVYWKRLDYLGLGIGAASLINNMRYKNTDAIEEYINTGGMSDYCEVQKLSVSEQMEEFMILGLRLTEGILKDEFYRLFNCSIESVYGDVLTKNEQDGLLNTDDKGARLTSKGLDLSNYVFVQFT